jgi:hypothetical protein
VWGSSYSGGHVLVLGAIDRRIKAVVAQVPLVSGSANIAELVRADFRAGFRDMFDADRAARFAGDPPAMVPVVDEDPLAPSALPTPDSWTWFTETGRTRAPSWRNEVTLRTVEMLGEYEPGTYIGRISPTPLLMVVAREHLPHFAMGMFTALDVSGPTRSATPAHVARAVFAVDDRRFVIPAALKTGTTVQFTNNSTKDVHEFSVGRLLPGKTTKDLVRWAKTEQGPPPYVPLGGAGAVSPHGRDWFLLNLPPGRYVALCLVPDDEPPHLAHAATGMVHTFTVTR